MSYQVLYRTYRPARFSEVVGQDYVVKTLKNAIKLNKIAHAYLFAGPRGTGKTSVAKLFAKAVNCDDFDEESCDSCKSCLAFNENTHPDIIELDAASNNGVEEIRNIVEQVNYAPILGRYKVYIIDEVHMLSVNAFKALLKTLEEPPAHVIFILATTDPQKIIPTVLSRCQRYNFSKITNFDMKRKMSEILKKEGIEYEDKAIDEVAILAEGGMRDALSILEQVLSYNDKGVFMEDIRKIFGLSSTEEKLGLLSLVHQNNITQAISSLREMYQSGVDARRLAVDLLEILKDALIYSDDADDKLLTRISKIQAMDLLNENSSRTLLNDIECLKDVLMNSNSRQNFLSYLELCLIRMSGFEGGKVQPIIKEEPKAEETKPAVEEEKTEAEPETAVQPAQEEETPEENSIEENDAVTEEIIARATEEPLGSKEESTIDIRYLASLLLGASKDEKISDAIIYNKLELYKHEADKRKFYELLNRTELFASAKDAIIIVTNDIEADNINSKETRDYLYGFLVNEFGLDKVIYAIKASQQKELVETYRELVKDKNNIVPAVEKPVIKKERTNEEKLRELFGDDLRVEE